MPGSFSSIVIILCSAVNELTVSCQLWRDKNHWCYFRKLGATCSSYLFIVPFLGTALPFQFHLSHLCTDRYGDFQYYIIKTWWNSQTICNTTMDLRNNPIHLQFIIRNMTLSCFYPQQVYCRSLFLLFSSSFYSKSNFCSAETEPPQNRYVL